MRETEDRGPLTGLLSPVSRRFRGLYEDGFPSYYRTSAAEEHSAQTR